MHAVASRSFSAIDVLSRNREIVLTLCFMTIVLRFVFKSINSRDLLYTVELLRHRQKISRIDLMTVKVLVKSLDRCDMIVLHSTCFTKAIAYLNMARQEILQFLRRVKLMAMNKKQQNSTRLYFTRVSIIVIEQTFQRVHEFQGLPYSSKL